MLILVHGAGECGKTTLAVKLAGMLGERGRRCIVLSLDKEVPLFGLLWPSRGTTEFTSVGELLESPYMDATAVADATFVENTHPNVGYIGYRGGENPEYFLKPRDEDVMRLIKLISGLCDVEVVDGSGMSKRQINQVAQQADAVVTSERNSLKTLCAKAVGASRLEKAKREIFVANSVRSEEKTERLRALGGKNYIEMPYCEELYRQGEEGHLTEELSKNRKNKPLRAALQQIEKELKL